VVTYTLAPSPAGVTFTDVCGTTGSSRTLISRDDGIAMVPETGSPVTIPFPLRMYGVSVTPPLSVSSNGWMSLLPTGVSGLGGTLGHGDEPNLTIAGVWADLVTRDGGVCYATVGSAPNRKFIVQWQDARWCCTDDPTVHLTFQVVINEATPGANNVIDVIYQRLDGTLRSFNAGIEDDEGSAAVPIPGPFTAPRAVRFTPSM
jgi:hypothetical protein